MTTLTRYRTAPAFVLGLLALLVAQTAAAVEDTAHGVVRETSVAMTSLLEDSLTYADKDPERYYAAVHEILDPVIDYRGFARGVMGPYATRERYKSLDAAGREQLSAQLDQFTETIRVSLVRTYSKGLLAFSGSRFVVNDPVGEIPAKGIVSVEQLVIADNEAPFVVLYQMGRNRDGGWKLRNVIIDAINLGQIYRSQFEAAARETDGNLDAVIANWVAPEADA